MILGFSSVSLWAWIQLVEGVANYPQSVVCFCFCYETLSLIHRILGKNKITEDVCLRAGEMFVQVNIFLRIMRRHNGYFVTNQSNVNISVLRKTFIISSIRLWQFVKLAAVVYVKMSLSCGQICLKRTAAWCVVFKTQ
jgi:hypothetical protein